MADLLNAHERPLWLNLLVLGAAAVVVWLSGTRLAEYGEIIAERTRLGEAFIGTLLLGVIGSLPEMAMALAAAAFGRVELAVNTLLGGIVFAILILAVVDVAVGREPLSSDIRRPVVPLQGALVVLLLAVAGTGIGVGDVSVLGVGAWTSGIAVLYLLVLVLIRHAQGLERWEVKERDPIVDQPETEPPARARRVAKLSLRRIAALTALVALLTLVAGTVAAQSADALSEQTGLGASFVGFLLGGFVTSLPELSSTVAAARLRQYELAFSDAFGTNLVSVMLLFLCDAVYAGGPILNEVERFSSVGILLGIAVTSVYVAGLLGRPKKVLLRMGVDSCLVLLIAAGGLVLLYALRSS